MLNGTFIVPFLFFIKIILKYGLEHIKEEIGNEKF